LRQRYQLTDQPHGVDLFLNGVNLVSDVPSVLDNDGNVLIAASSTNISFTLEDLRSGSIRALFNGKQDLNDAESSSVSLSLRPLNGASAELYQLQVEDLGDGRPDLLVRWREGSVVSGSLIENASVHTNHVPTPPQLHSLDLVVDSDMGFSGINGSFSLGTDQESALTLSDHQLIFSIEDIDGVVHTRQLALTSSLLIAGSDDHFLITETHPVFDGLQPKSIELQLQVIDAGHLTSLSVPLAVDVPAPPAVDDRPHLELPHGIRLSEGDTLEHLGHGLIPLLLRDRELTIDLPSDSGFAVADAQSIVLTVPAWILEVGQFTDVDGIPLDSGVFTDQDGTALDFDSLHNYDLVGIQLTHDTLNTLCYQPYRTATGRAPLSLQFQQTLDYQGSASNPVTLTQPLELRFRDGGDRIPSTSSGVFPSDPVEGDVWTLDFPVNTRLIDGVSGRELSLVDSNGYVDGYALLPGWQELFGGIGSASDLQLDVSPTTISARGHYSRSFIDSLQVLEADLSSSDDVITLTYSPATGESDISHALSLGAEELLIQTSDGATSFLPIDAHLNSALDAESSATPQALGWVMNDPIVISSDRSLQLPTLIENSDYSVELNRVDLGADDDDAVLTGSIADGLNLVLPQQDQASAVYTLDVSSSDFEMTEQFGALLSIAPGSFGVNALADGMLLAVSHDGLHGLSSPLWMRWTSASSRVVAPVEPAQAEQPSASSDPAPEPPEPSYQVDVVAGFQFFATENDALNRNPIERNTAALDLSVLGDFQLQYQSPAGHYQAYELSFSKDGITDPSLSRLLFIESESPSAVIAHLDFSAGVGADHQISLPVALSDSLLPPINSASAEAALSITGDLAGNLLGRDIGAVTVEPSWHVDGGLTSTVSIGLRGDRTTPSDYLASDPRSERSTESFLLTLQPDDAINSAHSSILITLNNDDQAPSLSITAIDQLSDSVVNGYEITLTSVIEADHPISSDQVRDGRVLLLRPDGLEPLRLGTISFNADGLQSAISATAHLQLPRNLSSIDLNSGGFRLAVDVLGGLQDVSEPFAWYPSTSEGGNSFFSFSRAEVEQLSLVDGQLQLSMPSNIGDHLSSLSLSVSADSTFGGNDYLLELDRDVLYDPEFNPDNGGFKYLAADPNGDSHTSRWLLHAQHDSTSGLTLHQAYYRPEVYASPDQEDENAQPPASALITGLQLPSAIVQSSGDQLTQLFITENGNQIWPDAGEPELNQPLTADAWSERLSTLALSLAPGEHQLNLTLVEHPSAAGSLTLFEQILHVEAIPLPDDSPSTSITPLATGTVDYTINEGAGLLLVNASDDQISQALAWLDTGSEEVDLSVETLGLQLAVQLQVLGQSPDVSSDPLDNWSSRDAAAALPEGASEEEALKPIHNDYVRSLQPFLYDNTGAENGQGVALTGFSLESNGVSFPLNVQRLQLGELEAWLIQPDQDLAGEFAIHATYSDGRSQLTQLIGGVDITNEPEAPRLKATQEVRDQLSWKLETGVQPDISDPIILTDLVYDPDPADILSFTLAPGSSLPDGLVFDQEAGTLTIASLPHSSIGEHLIDIVVSDGTPEPDLTLHFEFSISARDFSPVWNLPPQLDARLDGETSWDLEQHRWVLDPDGDSLRFSLGSPLPSGVSFSDGVLSVDPELAEAGRFVLDLNVSDGAERPLVNASTVLQLSRLAPLQPAVLLPVSASDRVVEEGSLMNLPLHFDRPLTSPASLQWMVHGGSDQVDAVAPLRGSLDLEAGISSAILHLQLPDDTRIQPGQQFFLQLQTDSPDLQLPSSPLALRQLDNDGMIAQLETRWLSATEVELVYTPATEAMATTGLRIELRDPSGSGLLQQAHFNDLFAMGWQSPVSDDHTLLLEWRDPLAATWPSLPVVSLLRLQLTESLPADVELQVAATSGRSDVAVHWLDQPWVELNEVDHIDVDREAIAEAQLAGAQVVVEQDLLGAVRFAEQGQLEVVDVAAVLERRFSTDPSFSVNTGDSTFSIDLSTDLQEVESSVRLSDTQWGLLPPLADGASRLGLQAEQVMVLSTDSGRLVDVSLQPLTDLGYEQLLQGLTVSGALGDSQSLQPVYGVMNFTYTDIEPGSLQTVSIDLPYRSVVDGVLSKPDETGAWSPFLFDTVDGTGAIFHDDDDDGFDDRVELRLRDGGRGDADGVINGEIVDPAIASSSDASNVPAAPTHVDMVLGHLLGVDGTLDSNNDAIDALSFTVAAGQRLWTLKIDDLTRNGGPVEAWLFSENDTIDLESTTPQILTASSTELLSLPLPSGDYTLVLRQLGGTSSYALRGVAEEVMPAPATFTVSSAATELNEGTSVSTMIDTTNVDPGTALYWRLEPHDGSEINADDFTTTISGSVILDDSGHGVIEASIEDDLTTEGAEQFVVAVYSDPQYTVLVGTGAAITIRDTSVAPVPSYALQSSASVDEGSTLAASAVTSNVSEGTTLHWQLLPLDDSAITPDDFTTPTTGSVVVGPAGVGDINIEVSTDYLTEGDEQFRLALYLDDDYTTLLSSRDVFINDTSLDLQQEVYLTTPSAVSFQKGQDVQLSLVYSTNSGVAPDTSLVLSVFYRSDVFSVANLEGLIALFDRVSTIDDINNLDTDPTTDSILQLEVDDLQGRYGSDLPATLADVIFTPPTNGRDPITGNPLNSVIHVKASSPASDDDLITGHDAVSIDAVGLGFNLDVDNDGTVTALGDGLMIIRKLFGPAFAGDRLTDKAISPNATRSPQEIHDFIQDGIDSGDLDVDHDGNTTALGDGLMVIRRLFGPAFDGERLIDKAISPTSSLIPQGSSLPNLTPEERDLLSDQVADSIDMLKPPSDPLF